MTNANRQAHTTNSRDNLVARFEALDFPPDEFRHVEHVQLAWEYLNQFSIYQALPRFVRSLQKFANHHGANEKYHETITWVFMVAINERRHDQPGLSWEQFRQSYPELFQWPSPILKDLYSDEELHGERAKSVFVLPKS